jgi:hypothetical protein
LGSSLKWIIIMVSFLDSSEYVIVCPELGVAIGLLVGVGVIAVVGLIVGGGVASGVGAGEELLYAPAEYRATPIAITIANTQTEAINCNLPLLMPLLSTK